MIVKDRIGHPKVDFNAKDFNKQKGYRITIEIDEDRVIETGVYLHWKNTQPVDIAVDISCMCGCTMNCYFCAAASTAPRRLSAEEIVEQVELSLDTVDASDKEFLSNIKTTGKITFSYQAIGEPSDSMICAQIEQSMKLLKEKYKNWNMIQFSISSVFEELEPLTRWAHLNFHTLQFSLHAPNDKIRREVINKKIKKNIMDILISLDAFHSSSPNTQIKINYLLIKDINDSQENARELLSLLESRNDYFLKISYLNETAPSNQHSFHASLKQNIFYEICKNKHSKTYIYGASVQLEMSCGQLASYCYPERMNEKITSDIDSLYEDIRAGKCSIFLGAGASYTAWDAKSLAHKLNNQLGTNNRFPENYDLRLDEIADLYEQHGKRAEVDREIKLVLKDTEVPRAMYTLTRYPWRSIYTTNYDDFIERAYKDAIEKKYATKNYYQILQPKDLQGLMPGEIPVIKLHGSISSGVRNVVSGRDYLDGYSDSIQLFLQKLAIDRLEGSILFVGYSFRDHFIKQWLYDLQNKIGDSYGRAWAVQPKSKSTIDDSKRLINQFGVTLLPITFDGLMRELDMRHRQPILMVSGSQKEEISGGEVSRIGATDKIEPFCKELATRLNAHNIKIVTGATATDKAGYLIGKYFDKKSCFSTYIWRGAEKIDGNDISKMINCREVGGKPSSVIDYLFREANILLVVGGGSLALRETLSAISRGISVIPISIGGNFASDIIHTFLSTQRDAVKILSEDIGIDAGFSALLMKIMTPERLLHLNLNVYSENVVANVVMELIQHITTLNSEVIINHKK